MNKKTFRGRMTIKEGDAGERGEFTAVFSTLNVVDLQNDVTVPGAFTDGQAVRVAYWGHRWEDLPVGRGVIHADRERAWIDGQFFLDTEGGLETYKTVKNLGDLQEWSYGFDIDKWSVGKFGDRDVRFLEKLTVYEVSPVLLGAGIGTRTTTIKSADDGAGDNAADDEGQIGEGANTRVVDEPSGVPARDVLAQIEILKLQAEVL